MPYHGVEPRTMPFSEKESELLDDAIASLAERNVIELTGGEKSFQSVSSVFWYPNQMVSFGLYWIYLGSMNCCETSLQYG